MGGPVDMAARRAPGSAPLSSRLGDPLFISWRRVTLGFNAITDKRAGKGALRALPTILFPVSAGVAGSRSFPSDAYSRDPLASPRYPATSA